MTVPNLQAAGSTAAVTTGSLTVTLPAHQADDILVVTTLDWVPNTSGAAALGATPSGWSVLDTGTNINMFGETDGHFRVFWKRAASGSETNPVFTRGAGWDTGTDTCFAGRAYCIRGCVTTGNPWDDTAKTTFHLLEDQAICAVDVDGSERLAMIFVLVADNTAVGVAPSGWTGGTSDVISTGTGANFNTYRKEAGADTSADASNVDATDQTYIFYGASFRPAVVSSGGIIVVGQGSIAASGTRQTFGAGSISGAGAVAATGARGQASGVEIVGAGTIGASGVRGAVGEAGVVGAGTIAAAGTRVAVGEADVAGAGTLSASGAKLTFGEVEVVGVGTIEASGVRGAIGEAAIDGVGSIEASGSLLIRGAAEIAGSGEIGVSTGLIRKRWPPGTDERWPDATDERWGVSYE